MSVNHPKEPFVGGGGGWHSRGHSLSTAVTTHGQEAVGEALGLDQKAATQGSGSSSRRGGDGRGQDQEKAWPGPGEGYWHSREVCPWIPVLRPLAPRLGVICEALRYRDTWRSL